MDVEDSQKESEDLSVNIGARLCEARDNLGLNSEKIAKELNLTVDIITKIEQNDFHQNIPAAFIRGYVKAYSTKVGLDTPRILAEFDSQMSAEAPSLSRVETISKFDNGRRELNSSSLVIKIVSGIVILLFLSYGGYQIWDRLSSTDSSNDIDLAIAGHQQGNEIELNSFSDENEFAGQGETGKTAEIETASELRESDSDANDKLINKSAGESSRSQSKVSSLSINDSTVLNERLEMTPLVFDFSADCWVRIVDARGEVIALGVKRAGKHMPIEGVKPINVVLGDPSVVSLQYNNQNYDLSQYRAGRRVEFILN